MPITELFTATRRADLAAQFGERRAKLLDQADSLIQLYRRHATTGVEMSADERALKDRRRSHCFALIALSRAEMAAMQGETVNDRRNRLRRAADRAEYLQRARDAERMGDHSAASYFESWAEVAKFRELLGAEST